MEGQPAVSCICLTYGRFEVLEEAIYSFLQQDYAGQKELIVLNDYAGQTLQFDHHEVQVINCPIRFRTLGEKRNAAVALASHALIFLWDDDDICLPHRLRFSIEHFDQHKGFFKPDKAFFMQDRKIQNIAGRNQFPALGCWSRELFDDVRGYVAEGTGCEFVFEQDLAQRYPGAIGKYQINPADIYYIYRWQGTGSYHISAYGSYKKAGENIGHGQVGFFVQQRAERGEIRQGHISLQPHWETDYAQLVTNYLATLAEPQAQGTSS